MEQYVYIIVFIIGLIVLIGMSVYALKNKNSYLNKNNYKNLIEGCYGKRGYKIMNILGWVITAIIGLHLLKKYL